MKKNFITIDEALHSMQEISEMTLQEVSALTGIKVSTLSRKLNQYDDGSFLNVCELTPVMNAFQCWIPLQVLCRINGGMFIKMPSGKVKKSIDPAKYQENFSRLFSLLLNFINSPSQDLYEQLDAALHEHMRQTATIQVSIQKNINQIDLDLK